MDFSSPTLWPLVVFVLAVIGLAAGILVMTHYLGERHSEESTHEVFESGVKETGSARIQFPIHFYIIAILFIVFDLEVVFIFAWGIAIKDAGWAGYIAILVFIVELMVLLIYLWRSGALDFGPDGKKILAAYHKRIKN